MPISTEELSPRERTRRRSHAGAWEERELYYLAPTLERGSQK